MIGTTVATVEGVEHRIPNSWLSGFCRAQGGLPAKSTAEAVRWWHEQWKLVHRPNYRPAGIESP